MAKKQINAIEIKGLSKTYSKGKKTIAKQALSNVDLSIPQGGIYGLLGPNGAGKSTLINILAGLSIKSEGKVHVNGFDIDKDPRQVQYQLGVVPQEVIIDPFFSVYETLEYYAGYFGVPKKERRTQEIIDALHLTDKANVNSRRLSGGMKRRVLIAKALVHTPSILILDEPTAGVDVELRIQLWDYVRELNKRGTTILLTTHYLEEAEDLCDRIAIINHGKIIAEDNTQSLLKKIDKKCVILTFDKKLTAIPKSFKTLNAELTDDGRLIVSYKKSTAKISDIFALIEKEKLVLKDITSEEPDLEDIFRSLVTNDVNAA